MYPPLSEDWHNPKRLAHIFAGVLFLLAVGVGIYLFYPHYPETSCANYQLNQNSIFIQYIDSMAEKNHLPWQEMENRYDIFFDERAVDVAENPQLYFCEALHVIKGKDYDQSQKMFATIVMKRLPIHDYIALMRIGNNAYEQGIITDKSVIREIISPDGPLKNTAATYWFLPAWRKQFNRHAPELFNPNDIENILQGNTFWGLTGAF